METSMKIFLAVAKEMSISQAARKLYTSQQTVSYHIKQLESEYGVRLFNRSPHLSLTPAGEKMVWTLQQIEALENNLLTELKGDAANYPDKVRVMMPEARFSILADRIIKEFYSIHPSIMLEFKGNMTYLSETALLNGEADMFIGVNPTHNPQFDISLIHHESTFLIGRHKLFVKTIPDFESKIEKYKSDGVPYEAISGAPIIIPDTNGILGKQLENYFKLQQITPNTYLRSNNAELHISLCNSVDTFGILPEMFLYLLKTIPQEQGNEILYFPIQDFPFSEDICLVRFNGQPHSPVTDNLARIIKNTVTDIYASIAE